MATLMIPAGNKTLEFELEQGYLLPSEATQASLGEAPPSIDLFEKTSGNVEDAVEFLLSFANQGEGV